MSNVPAIPGSLLQFDEPKWQPLADLVGEELLDWFMWMHEIRLVDGREVHAYKHVATRRYVHVALSGETFLYEAESYRPMSRAAAIREAFHNWVRSLPQSEDPLAVETLLVDAITRA